MNVIVRSSREPGYIAASNPNVRDRGMAMIATAAERRNVLVKRGAIISEIGVPDRAETRARLSKCRGRRSTGSRAR